ncbi:glycosyltransferase family 4 protein [Candidatus Omnitrophota bacterium]
MYTHCFPPYTGGSSTYAFELARGLSRLQHSVTAVVPEYSSDSTNIDHGQPYEVKRTFRRGSSSKKNIVLGVIYLAFQIFKIRPSFIIVTDIESHMVCAIVRMFTFCRIITVVHGEEPFVNNAGIKKHLFHYLISKSTHIIASSNFTRHSLLEKQGDIKDKVYVVNPGVDIAKFQKYADPRRIADRHSIGSNKVILTIARLVPRKGQDTVIRSLPVVIKKYPDVRYIIGGQGPDNARLKNLVKELGLGSYVIFAGHIDDGEINSYYELCDIFAMISRKEHADVEGFGISFLEANLKGKPVIGGLHGGVPEAIIQNKTGLLVDPRDKNEVAHSILELLSNPSFARNLGDNGRRRCLANFSWENASIAFSKLITYNNAKS